MTFSAVAFHNINNELNCQCNVTRINWWSSNNGGVCSTVATKSKILSVLFLVKQLQQCIYLLMHTTDSFRGGQKQQVHVYQPSALHKPALSSIQREHGRDKNILTHQVCTTEIRTCTCTWIDNYSSAYLMLLFIQCPISNQNFAHNKYMQTHRHTRGKKVSLKLPFT